MDLKRRRNGSRAIAALLLLSIAQISLQVGFAAPAIAPQLVGRLTTKNNQPITVNGLSANTGASIVSGATLETGADQSATVDLGPLGSLEIGPNTKVVLTFDEKNSKAVIINGCVILTTKTGTAGEIGNEQGMIGKTEPTAGGVLNNCSPQPGPAPSTGGEDGGGLFGLGKAATIVIFTAGGLAALTPVFFFQGNPSGSNP